MYMPDRSETGRKYVEPGRLVDHLLNGKTKRDLAPHASAALADLETHPVVDRLELLVPCQFGQLVDLREGEVLGPTQEVTSPRR